MCRERITLLCLFPILLFCGACEKCQDCRQSQFNSTERALIYEERDIVRYSDGNDTVSVVIEHEVASSKDEECASFPLKPNCTSLGWARLDYQYSADSPLGNIHRISISKHNEVFQCTNFEIGNTFFVNFDGAYKLTPLNNNNYQINELDNYVFNQANYGDVQEIIQTAPLGNASELIKALYHPEFGILELTYSNPTETWRQIPN